MTIASAAREPIPRSALPEGMSRGVVLSATLHVFLGGLFLFGLPTLFRPTVPEEMPIAVELVNLGPETRATNPNPYTPHRNAKPIPAKAEPTPEPKEKPQPAPTPSASAEAAAPAATPP